MIRLLIVLVFVSSMIPLQAQSQSGVIKKHSFSVWAGIRNISHDSLANTDNIDFLNYLSWYPDMSEYQYIGFSSHIWFRGRFEADLSVAMYDDFAPTQLNAGVTYFPLMHLGVTCGFFIYPQYINDYDMYHRLHDDGFYGDVNSNARQRRLNESGVMAGVVMPFSYRAFTMTLSLTAGVSNIETFSEVFYQKEILSNYRRKIVYETKPSPGFFFMPGAEIGAELFRLGTAKGGLRARTTWYTVNRAVSYDRTVTEWTESEGETSPVTNPVHHFEKLDIDLGIFIRW